METNFTGKRTRFSNVHPLKKHFSARKIPLWCLRNYTGIPESKLSRYFNLIDPMPPELSHRLYGLLHVLEGGTFEQWEEVSRIGVKIREKMLDDEIASTEKEYDCKSKEEPNESGSTD